jgi:hypothetical protein
MMFLLEDKGKQGLGYYIIGNFLLEIAMNSYGFHRGNAGVSGISSCVTERAG